jgi:hypothetical protein
MRIIFIILSVFLFILCFITDLLSRFYFIESTNNIVSLNITPFDIYKNYINKTLQNKFLNNFDIY